MAYSLDTFVKRCLLIFAVGIITLIPFHALVTVWIGSQIDAYTIVRLWKEFVLFVLVLSVGWLVYRDTALRRWLLLPPQKNLLYILTAYLAITVVAGLISFARGDVTLQALGYGYISNTRYIIFFIICSVTGYYWKDWFLAYWKHIVLIPAALVVGFGLLQAFVLPADVLKHVGYGPGTIQPYIAVDQKDEFARLQSTMRGPNPLGAYLVVIGVTALALLLLRRRVALYAAASISVLFVLYGTFSRSAAIGAIIATVLYVCLVLPKKYVRPMLGVLACALIITSLGIYVLRDNNYVQNVVFHTDETSKASVSSNDDRGGALLEGLQDLVSEPFGRGVGTAGPASVYNNGEARIAENYYIQIGQEVGIIGTGLLIAISCMVCERLWCVRNRHILAPILLASFGGLVFVALVSHSWTDDTLAYLWWGLAGLTIGALSQHAKKRYEKTK